MSVKHVALYHDLFPTTWGWVGIVYSDRGLRRVILPRPNRRVAKLALEKTFRGVVRSRPWPRLRSQLKMYFAGKRPDLDLPLDLLPPGDFTGRAWKAAQGIPYGRRLTYRELAQRAGCSGGARAAGQAMAKNPVPIIVPCHRVVGAGNIGGFSSGIGMKTRLLSLEGGSEKGHPASRTPGKKRRLRKKR